MDIDRLFELYIAFLNATGNNNMGNNNNVFALVHKGQRQISDVDQNMIDIHLCQYLADNCTVLANVIENQIQNYRGLQLRDVLQNAHNLIIGCGNVNPRNGEQEYWLLQNQEGDLVHNHDNWGAYYDQHQHPEVITLDISLGMNPTFVADFLNSNIIELMPNNHFMHINFEGFDPLLDIHLAQATSTTFSPELICWLL